MSGLRRSPGRIQAGYRAAHRGAGCGPRLHRWQRCIERKMDATGGEILEALMNDRWRPSYPVIRPCGRGLMVGGFGTVAGSRGAGNDDLLWQLPGLLGSRENVPGRGRLDGYGYDNMLVKGNCTFLPGRSTGDRETGQAGRDEHRFGGEILQGRWRTVDFSR